VNDVIGKYATELADINCPKCGSTNRINTKGITVPEWSCKECGYSPDWETLYSKETDVYPCSCCGKDISEDTSTVMHCRNCSIEAQKREKMRRNQCCPHCEEMLSVDDLREIKESRRKARRDYEKLEEEETDGDAE